MLLSFNVLSDNSIKLSPYRPIYKRYEYVNESYKYDKLDREFKHWQPEDIKRIQRNYNASLHRAVKNIKALSDLNKFDYFVTITFNQEYVNRKSAEEVHHHFKLIVKRLAYHFDGLEYLATPEFHFDEAIHYHCFMTFGKTPKLHYKGLTKKGQPIYTISKNDRFKNDDCFITIEKIEKEQPVWYLIKYMTKSQGKPLHRRFMCSRGLKRVHRLANHKIDISKRDFERIADTCFGDFQAYGYVTHPHRKYTPADIAENDSERSSLDLSINSIKGENQRAEVLEKYYSILGILLEYGKIVPPKEKAEENNPF